MTSSGAGRIAPLADVKPDSGDQGHHRRAGRLERFRELLVAQARLAGYEERRGDAVEQKRRHQQEGQTSAGAKVSTACASCGACWPRRPSWTRNWRWRLMFGADPVEQRGGDAGDSPEERVEEAIDDGEEDGHAQKGEDLEGSGGNLEVRAQAPVHAENLEGDDRYGVT